MDDYLGRDLRKKLANPLIFQRKPAAARDPVGGKAHGYDATILIDLCKAIIDARRVVGQFEFSKNLNVQRSQMYIELEKIADELDEIAGGVSVVNMIRARQMNGCTRKLRSIARLERMRERDLDEASEKT